MKIGEAELWLRQELQVMYDESEAINIASLVMENITRLNKSDRLLKKRRTPECSPATSSYRNTSSPPTQ